MTSDRSTVLAIVLLASGSTWADVDASAVTNVVTRPITVDGNALAGVAAIETVSLRSRTEKTAVADDVKVMLSAWGMVGPDNIGHAMPSGDVDIAYVEGKVAKKWLGFRIGRQAVTGGAARMTYLDGITVSGNTPIGLGAQVSFGMPAAARFSQTFSNRWEFLSRLSFAPNPIRWALGASFVYYDDHGARAREDLGLDGRFSVTRWLNLNAAAMFSLIDTRFSEIDTGLSFHPLESFELNAGYRRTQPDLLIPRTSIFSVFSDTSRDEVGGSIFLQPAWFLSLYGDARGLFITPEVSEVTPVAENGIDTTLRATLKPGRRSNTSLSVQGRLFRVPANGYLQGRISATHQLRHNLRLSADFDVYSFDKPINGQSLSLTGAGAINWQVAPSWNVSVSVAGGPTATYVRRVEAFARLTWTMPTQGATR